MPNSRIFDEPMMKALRILLLVLTVPRLVGAQPHPILKSFEGYKQPNGILLRWVIKGGNQCQGTKVFRSADGLEFEQINHIPGICGNFTEDETYSFFDSIPHRNAYNYYRLELGFQGFTELVTVFFEAFEGGDHLLLSDKDRFQILFTNDLGRTTTLDVFDRSGTKVMTQRGTRSDHVIHTGALKRGVYIFRISGADVGTIFGKIFVGP